MARTTRLVLLALIALSAGWAGWIGIHGGVRFSLGGQVIRGSDPRRPVLVSILAALAFLALGGRADLRRLARPLSRWASPSNLAWGLAVGALVVSSAYSTTTAGGADSSGYVSQADLWRRGQLTLPQPWAARVPWPNAAWTFTPLGYTPIDLRAPFRQAPTYSPGLPLLMAAAKTIGGQAGLYAVVPVCAFVLVLSVFRIGQRMRGPWTGLTAAWLAATGPVCLAAATAPMSDLPAGAAWTAAFSCVMAEGLGSAVGAGLLAGLAIVIRPNLATLAALMLVWFWIRPDGDAAGRRGRRWRDAAAFSAGVVPGALVVAILFDRLYGSPFVSGYGGFADSHELAHVWPNLVHYAKWALVTEPVLLIAGLAGLLLPTVWPTVLGRRAARVAGLLTIAVTVEYSLYLVFDDWTYLRFFLPAYGLAAVTAAGAIVAVADHGRRAMRAVVVAAVLGAGILGLVTARARYVFDGWHAERRYIAAAEILHDLAAPNSVVFAMQHSGSLRYYSGVVPLRYDTFDGPIDEPIRWLAAAGVEAYAVVDASELSALRQRLVDPAHRQAADRPVAIYRGYENDALVYIYDLTSPPAEYVRPRIVIETDPGRWRNWPPGPLPTLALR
jgi:hypothetical protein